MSNLNVSKLLRRQGLDKTQEYAGTVVDNNDPRKLGRIKVRIIGIFDGIEDQDLPWAILKPGHAFGSYNNGQFDVKRCGNFYVPRISSKVCVMFPQDGDPHQPVYTSYTVDDLTMLPESKTNYPDRAVIRFSHGMYIIVDSKTNELFINNPGDLHMTILGSVNQYIVGNQMLKITDNLNDVSPYLLNAPDKIMNGLKANPYGKIPFEGLMSKSKAGNQHTKISGDQTTEIMGNRKTIIRGSDTTTVYKMSEYSGPQMSHTLKAGKVSFN
jgi:hypothetical protein